MSAAEQQPLQLTTCPECGAAAEISARTVLESTDGPIEHVHVRCVARHWFMMPSFALPSRAAPARTTSGRSGVSSATPTEQ